MEWWRLSEKEGRVGRFVRKTAEMKQAKLEDGRGLQQAALRKITDGGW